MLTLHLTNGDLASSALARSGLPGDIVSWRDLLHDGPVPRDDDLEAFHRVRGHFLASRGWSHESDAVADFAQRDARLEAVGAGDEVVLFEDELLVVADKPHFLPVTPAGRYLQETLLVRLRRRLGIDSLVPLHRIDRETAGLVLFAKQAATRKAYHALFAQRSVAKTYQAIAAWQPQRAFPLTRASVMQAGSLFMQMCEQDGPDLGEAMPNAVTTVGWLETRAGSQRAR